MHPPHTSHVPKKDADRQERPKLSEQKPKFEAKTKKDDDIGKTPSSFDQSFMKSLLLSRPLAEVNDAKFQSHLQGIAPHRFDKSSVVASPLRGPFSPLATVRGERVRGNQQAGPIATTY
jgi:hypothetical protein